MIIKPILSDRVKADGTRRVNIYLYDETLRTKDRIRTPYFVKKIDWDGAQVHKKSPGASYINPQLEEIRLDILGHWNKNQHLSTKQVKAWYEGPKTAASYTPATYFRHYIEQCREGKITKKKTKEKMTTGYLKALGTSCAQLESYGPVSWGQMNEEFLDAFVTWLRDKNFKQNTIAKYVKYIVIISNYARKKNIHQNDLLEYSVLSEKSQKIRLTPVEVEAIINLDLSESPELIPEWERFQVAYNLLLRFGDTISINEKNIAIKNKKAYLSAFTQKGKKEILLPIKASVYKILKKNNFQVKATNSQSNERLKLLGMKAKINSPVTFTEFKNGVKTEVVYKKYQKIETHTTRRSAARNLFDAGMAPEIIMVLGGWTTMKQLLDYIDIDLEYAASKAVDHPFFQ